MKAGDIQISFGGIRNPVSFLATDVFTLNSTDANGYQVGDGSIDNIKMTIPATFTEMTVVPTNKTNGAVTDYLISF